MTATDIQIQAAPASRPGWRQRRWVQLTAVGLVAFGVGAAAGGSGANSHASQIKALQADKAALSSQLADAKSQAASEQAQVSAAQSDATTAQNAASHAVAAAKQQVAGEDAATRAKLRAQQTALNTRASDLTRQEREFQNQVSDYNASAIGEGLYVVGQDIKPGVYHTSGDGGSGNCYWARLASDDTGNILDNANTTGPTTVTILGSDKAFQTEGCADWHKVG